MSLLYNGDQLCSKLVRNALEMTSDEMEQRPTWKPPPALENHASTDNGTEVGGDDNYC